MNFPTKTFAALMVSAAVPLFAGQASAAPMNQAAGLNSANAELAQVEQVQYRRNNRNRNWRGGNRRGNRWIGPAAGVAAGVAIGSALASPYAYGDDGYYAYGAAPGYGGGGYGAGYRSDPCVGDSGYNSAYPAYRCRPFPRATDRNHW